MSEIALTGDASDAAIAKFDIYSVVSSISVMLKWPVTITKHHGLFALVSKLLDPADASFHKMCMVCESARNAADRFDIEFLDPVHWFWKIERLSDNPSTKAWTLLNLLILMNSNDNCVLARQYLEENEDKGFLRCRLKMRRPRFWHPRSVIDYHEKLDVFDHSIIEVFALVADYKASKLNFLLDYGTGYFDPTTVLLFYIARHGRRYGHSHGGQRCPLERLLELGGDPNPNGSWVTPLQIAVVSYDSIATKMLLEAGADVNGIGDIRAVRWEEDSVMSQFNHLHAASPLYIYREFDPITLGRTKENEPGLMDKILPQYGAEAFRRA